MKKKQTPSVGGAKKPGPGIGIADAVAVGPAPGRARFVPIDDRAESTDEGDRRRDRCHPRRDPTRL